jgi:chemotaxis protein CheC
MAEIELDQMQLDALKEINSIAAGNAATSLSAMLGRKVDITVPSVIVEALGKVPEVLGGEDKIVNVVCFSVSGQVSGSILLILSISECLGLASVLTGQKVSQTEDLDEMALSALKELGNITTGTYLRALGQGLKIKITHSIPEFASDMLGAILDGILARLSFETGYALVVESELAVEGALYGTHIVFIPKPEAMDVMLRALGVWGQ